MADEQQTPAGAVTTAPTPARPATFRAVPTVALVAVAFLALCLSPIAFQGGWWFLTFLVPAVIAVWVVRARTRVDADGVHVRGALRTRTVRWDDVSGLRLTDRGGVRAVRTTGPELDLRGVRIRDLGRVGEASGGRIDVPTPAQAQAAAEHARELEAARMRVANLRARQAAETGAETDHEPGADPDTDDGAPAPGAEPGPLAGPPAPPERPEDQA